METGLRVQGLGLQGGGNYYRASCLGRMYSGHALSAASSMLGNRKGLCLLLHPFRAAGGLGDNSKPKAPEFRAQGSGFRVRVEDHGYCWIPVQYGA